MSNKVLKSDCSSSVSSIDSSDLEISPDVRPTKKCKKAYSQLTKSILRGISNGVKRGIKESIEAMNLESIDATSEAVNFILEI
jgi:hypothetical protein